MYTGQVYFLYFQFLLITYLLVKCQLIFFMNVIDFVFVVFHANRGGQFQPDPATSGSSRVGLKIFDYLSGRLVLNQFEK